MAHWISIEEGTYLLDEAFLVTPDHSAVTLHEGVIDVYLDNADERRVRGRGMAVNVLLVELLEDNDEIDLLIDLGEQFKYFLKSPSIMAGKIFSPDVKSLIHFIAKGPVEKLPVDEYERMKSRLALLD